MGRTSTLNRYLARYCRALLFAVLVAGLLFCFPFNGPAGPARGAGAGKDAETVERAVTLGGVVSLQQRAADMSLEATGVLADAVLSGPEEWDQAGAAASAREPSYPGEDGLPGISPAAKEPAAPEDEELAGVSREAEGLPVPSGLTVTQYGQDYLLQWNPVSDPQLAGYNVYRSFFSSPKMKKGKKLNKQPVLETSYFDTSVKNRKRTQYYSVSSVNVAGQRGPRSEGVAVQPWLPDANPPAPVAGVDAGFVEEGLSAAWTASNQEPDLGGYNLYLSDAQGRLGSRLNPRPVQDTFFFAEGVTAGAGPRYLAVRSVDTTGNESVMVQDSVENSPFRVYEDDAPEIVYSGLWKQEKYPDAHGGAIVVANDAGACLELTFTGRSIKVYTANYWTCGGTEIYLDGNLVATVDQYSDSTRYGVLSYRNYVMRPGTHVIRIVATGRPLSPEQVSGYHFTNLDYLQIH